MHTDISKIHNIHYNQCRKPWNCIGEGSGSGKFGKNAIPEDQVHLGHCLKLMTVWHNVRHDLETKLLALTKDKTIDTGRAGDYKRKVFRGHCKGYGGDSYLPLAGIPTTFHRISDLYQKK